MKPLIRHNVFQMCTQVDGSRLKEEKTASAAEIFQQAADAIYTYTGETYHVAASRAKGGAGHALFADAPFSDPAQMIRQLVEPSFLQK